MDVAVPFLSSLAAIYAIAGAAIALIRSRFRILGWVCAGGVLSAPLIIPASEVLHRAAASILSLDCGFRLVDLLRTGHRKNSFREDLWFIVPFPVMNALQDWKRRSFVIGIAKPNDWWTLAFGCIAFGICWAVLEAVSSSSLLISNHLLDHTFKFALFVAAVEFGARALCAVERLAGFQTTPIVNRAWASITPAEFWRRWTNRINAWLHRHVFRNCGAQGIRFGRCLRRAFSAAFSMN